MRGCLVKWVKHQRVCGYASCCGFKSTVNFFFFSLKKIFIYKLTLWAQAYFKWFKQKYKNNNYITFCSYIVLTSIGVLPVVLVLGDEAEENVEYTQEDSKGSTESKCYIELDIVWGLMLWEQWISCVFVGIIQVGHFQTISFCRTK